MSLAILVTGGAGYVGSHAVKVLVGAGHRVTVLDDLSRGHRDAVIGAEIVEADLREASQVRRAFAGRSFDLVMHFAALCYVGESMQRPLDYYRTNLVGSLNLLEAMLEAPAPKLVFSSTCATYGIPAEVPIGEAHPQRPVNPYGTSKLAVEMLLRDAAAAHGLASVSLRYFNAAGCDPDGRLGERHDPETHLIPLALREALRVRGGGDPAGTALVVHGDDYPTPDGTCIRDYVHVEDLGRAHLGAALGLADGTLTGASAFNLGSERGFSVLEVIEACRQVTGIPIRYRVGPRRPGDPPRLVAASASAREKLGWQPRHADLRDIVRTAWSWFSRAS